MRITTRALIPILFLFNLANNFGQVTPCTAGYAGIYPCDKIDMMSFVPIASMGGTGNANDVWGWTDPLDGKEYAIVGLTNGTSFLDISDPLSPINLGILHTASVNSSWRDMKVIGNHVYIGSEALNHGVQSFDLTNLRSVVNPPVTFSALSTFTSFGTGSSHNIVALEDDNAIVIVGAGGTGGCSGGLILVDVSDPSNMNQTGCFSADGYTHDAVCFTYRGPDTEHYGKQICIASNEDTQTIVDVTDKNSPAQLSKTGYTESKYTHQGWVTDDHKYLLFDDEIDEITFGFNTRTHMMDISDLDNPTYMGYHTSSSTAVDHNQYVKGQYTYQANYRSGLRILNIENIANASLVEEAFFDTQPADDLASTSHVWSVYPYFKSGIVIANDINLGLFILRPNLPHFVLEANPKVQCRAQADDVVVNINLDAYSSYSDLVDLSVTGLPAGAIASFGANPIASSGSTTLTISNTGLLLNGYSVVIEGRGQSTNAVHDFAVSFTISAPDPANTIFPTDNSTAIDPGTTLKWLNSSDGSSYLVEIASDVDFTNIVYSQNEISDTSHTVYPPLGINQEYFWRITGTNICSAIATSATKSFTTSCGVPSGNRLFVDSQSPNTSNGASWGCPYNTIQDALSVANAGDTILISAGTYFPSTNGNRNTSFSIADELTLMGGFSGVETSPAEQAWELNPTILSGDIGIVDDNSDNTYHVINNSSLATGIVIDGFIIENGNANGAAATQKNGGGIYNSSSVVTIKNTIVRNNTASLGEGRGIFNSNSNLILENVTIIDPELGVDNSVHNVGAGNIEINGTVIIKN